MKTLTLEQAVAQAINEYIVKGQHFTAHEITTSIRQEVNSGKLEILGIPFGYVDATNTHSQQITHADVRSIVDDIAQVLALTVQYSNGYRVFTKASIPASIPASISNPPSTPLTGIAVPQRFTVGVNDTAKARVTRYIRNKLNNGETVTIRRVQSAIKSNLTVNDIEAVIKAEGWTLDMTSGVKSHFTVKP